MIKKEYAAAIRRLTRAMLQVVVFGLIGALPCWADSTDFTPEADTYVAQANPDTNFGAGTVWGISNDPQFGGIAYLRFNVSLPTGAAITDARLLVVCENTSADPGGGGTIKKFIPNDPLWSESTPTWNNKLAGSEGSILYTLGPVTAGQAYEFTGLASAVTGNGQVSFILRSTVDDGAKYYSAEYTDADPTVQANRRPKLRITYTPASTSAAVVTPTITPAGGTFGTSQSVTLATSTSGATIRYTTDGTTPSKESTPYTAAFTVSANTTVKAFAYKNGMADSPMATASFLQTASTGSTIMKTATETSAASAGWTVSGTERYCWTPPQWLEYSVGFPTSGSWTFSLTGKNETNPAAPGLPAGFAYAIDVSVDGVYKTTFNVTGSTGTWQTGTSPAVTVASGTHTVRFTWTNDAWLSGVYDANLRVQKIAFNGTARSSAFLLVSPASGVIVEADSDVAVKSAGGAITGTFEYQLLLDSAVIRDWNTAFPSLWKPSVANLGKRTLTLKVRNSPTGTPQQASSDVFVLRSPIQHP